jgi:hypothetical protein
MGFTHLQLSLDRKSTIVPCGSIALAQKASELAGINTRHVGLDNARYSRSETPYFRLKMNYFLLKVFRIMLPDLRWSRTVL